MNCDHLFVADVPTDGIHTTEWEREREREEFAQAARLYRPLSAMIASRFTRAKYDDDDKVSLPADDSVCYVLSHYLNFCAVIIMSEGCLHAVLQECYVSFSCRPKCSSATSICMFISSRCKNNKF